MHHSVLSVACLLMMVSLAGCAEEGATATFDPSQEFGEDLQATDSTGIIRGVVVDEAITPIAGVAVSVKGQALETITDENGFFGFDGLEAGSYFLSLSKTGWESQQTGATVKAGEAKPALVRVLLVEDPESLPTTTVLKFDGIIQCSVSIIAVGFAACNTLGLGDKFIAQYTSDQLGTPVTFVQGEMIWTSTQPAGDRMSFMYSAPGGGALLDNFAEARDVSPLVIRANQTVLEAYDVPNSNPLMMRVFNAPIEGTDAGETVGDPTDGDNCYERPVLGGCTTGLGATIDQRFVAYHHIFHNWIPDPEWTFGEDSDPVYPGS